ncbi:MAG: hypothetical protein R3E87_20595 [Burkholderiaceae bacterium]
MAVKLTAWIHVIARAGVPFRYTENGSWGLLLDKTVYVALARGGIYRGTDNDLQMPCLKSVLGFGALLVVLAVGAVIRVVMPLAWPTGTTVWIGLFQASWVIAFGILFVRQLPMLAFARADGRPGRFI